MQKSGHTAFFAFKVQGEKAVRYTLFSLLQPEHAKRKGGVKMRKRAFCRSRDPCILCTLPKREYRKHSGGRDAETPKWPGRWRDARIPQTGAGCGTSRCVRIRES